MRAMTAAYTPETHSRAALAVFAAPESATEMMRP
jgi:hypothetical protein